MEDRRSRVLGIREPQRSRSAMLFCRNNGTGATVDPQQANADFSNAVNRREAPFTIQLVPNTSSLATSPTTFAALVQLTSSEWTAVSSAFNGVAGAGGGTRLLFDVTDLTPQQCLQFLNFRRKDGPATPAQNSRITRVHRVMNAFRPRFSPVNDAQLVIDRIEADGYHDMYIVNDAGTFLVSLTVGRTGVPQLHNGNGRFHPNGRYIIWPSQDVSNGQPASANNPGVGMWSNLYAIRLDGTTPYVVTKLTTVDFSAGQNGAVAQVNPLFNAAGARLYWTERYSGVGGTGTWGSWRVRRADFSLTGTSPNDTPAIANNAVVFTAGSSLGSQGTYVTCMGVISSSPEVLLLAGNLSGQHEYHMSLYRADLTNSTLTRLTGPTTPVQSWEEGSCVTPNGRVVYMTNEYSGYPLDTSNTVWEGLPREGELNLITTTGTQKERLTHFCLPTAPDFLGRRTAVFHPDVNVAGTKIAVPTGFDTYAPEDAPLVLNSMQALILHLNAAI